jgi:mono/diheme cytochrome c family protein
MFAVYHSKFWRINIVNTQRIKMKKQILLITALIFTIVLSACGTGTPLPTTEPASPTEAVAQPTQAPAVTDTVVPATEAPTATEALATEASTTDSSATAVSFVNDIKPIFDTRCIKCHGVERTKEGLDMQTYDNIMAGSRNGPVIEPGNADNSFLVQQIVDGEMPDRGDPVTPEELQLIIDWVNQGALNN